MSDSPSTHGTDAASCELVRSHSFASRLKWWAWLSLTVMLFGASATEAATTYSWTGAASNLWSNPSNWDPIGVPGNGDSIALPSDAPNLANTNDLPLGTSFEALAVTGSGYTIGGHGIVLTRWRAASGSGDVITLPIDVQANEVT